MPSSAIATLFPTLGRYAIGGGQKGKVAPPPKRAGYSIDPASLPAFSGKQSVVAASQAPSRPLTPLPFPVPKERRVRPPETENILREVFNQLGPPYAEPLSEKLLTDLAYPRHTREEQAGVAREGRQVRIDPREWESLGGIEGPSNPLGLDRVATTIIDTAIQWTFTDNTQRQKKLDFWRDWGQRAGKPAAWAESFLQEGWRQREGLQPGDVELALINRARSWHGEGESAALVDLLIRDLTGTEIKVETVQGKDFVESASAGYVEQPTREIDADAERILSRLDDAMKPRRPRFDDRGTIAKMLAEGKTSEVIDIIVAATEMDAGPSNQEIADMAKLRPGHEMYTPLWPEQARDLQAAMGVVRFGALWDLLDTARRGGDVTLRDVAIELSKTHNSPGAEMVREHVNQGEDLYVNTALAFKDSQFQSAPDALLQLSKERVAEWEAKNNRVWRGDPMEFLKFMPGDTLIAVNKPGQKLPSYYFLHQDRVDRVYLRKTEDYLADELVSELDRETESELAAQSIGRDKLQMRPIKKSWGEFRDSLEDHPEWDMAYFSHGHTRLFKLPGAFEHLARRGGSLPKELPAAPPRQPFAGMELGESETTDYTTPMIGPPSPQQLFGGLWNPVRNIPSLPAARPNTSNIVKVNEFKDAIANIPPLVLNDALKNPRAARVLLEGRVPAKLLETLVRYFQAAESRSKLIGELTDPGSPRGVSRILSPEDQAELPFGPADLGATRQEILSEGLEAWLTGRAKLTSPSREELERDF